MNPLLFPIIEKVIGTVSNFLDPSKKAEAELAILKLQQDASFREVENELERLKVASANITTEGGSTDPWTSRARPTFMYVIYILILSAIPMGILSAWSPDTAIAVTTGFKAWLDAIPGDMLALFGVGYVGYAGARSLEKIKGATR